MLRLATMALIGLCLSGCMTAERVPAEVQASYEFCRAHPGHPLPDGTRCFTNEEKTSLLMAAAAAQATAPTPPIVYVPPTFNDPQFPPPPPIHYPMRCRSTGDGYAVNTMCQ